MLITFNCFPLHFFCRIWLLHFWCVNESFRLKYSQPCSIFKFYVLHTSIFINENDFHLIQVYVESSIHEKVNLSRNEANLCASHNFASIVPRVFSNISKHGSYLYIYRILKLLNVPYRIFFFKLNIRKNQRNYWFT